MEVKVIYWSVGGHAWLKILYLVVLYQSLEVGMQVIYNMTHAINAMFVEYWHIVGGYNLCGYTMCYTTFGILFILPVIKL